MSQKLPSTSNTSDVYSTTLQQFRELNQTVEKAILRKEEITNQINAPNAGANTKAGLRSELNAVLRNLNVDRMNLGRVKKQLLKFPEGAAEVKRLEEEKKGKGVEEGEGEDRRKRPLFEETGEEGPKKRRIESKEMNPKAPSPTLYTPASKSKPKEAENANDDSESEEETVKKPRMADRWYKLTAEQKRRLLKKYTTALSNLLDSKFSRLPPTVLRTWARREQTFFPELGFFNRFLAMWAFVKKGDSVMRCHYHEINDHSCKVNDIAAHDGLTKNSFKVTGVPFESTTQPLFDPVSRSTSKALKLDERRPSDAIASDEEDSRPVYRTIDDLYRLCRVRNGRRILHCGCDLEEALFGFFVWKRFITIKSRSRTETEEPFERPLDPRTRHYLYDIFTSFFGLTVDDLYMYDLDGKERTQQDMLSSLIRSLKAAFSPRIQDERRRKEQEDEDMRRAVRRTREYHDLDDFEQDGPVTFEDEDTFEDEEEEWGGIQESSD